MNITEDLKRLFFRPSSALIRLIVINASIFFVLKFILVIQFLFKAQFPVNELIIKYLSVPSSLSLLLERPWTLFSYMFLHQGFFHILFNMLWLFWFGSIFMEYLGDKKLVFTYIAGGLSGALLYIFSFNVFPVFNEAVYSSFALGASASVMAIVFATATLLPDYSFVILFLGPVKIKYIAFFYLVLDFISIGSLNSGGHIAHIGGAFFGFVFIRLLRSGKDLSVYPSKVTSRISKLFNRKKKLNVKYKQETRAERKAASKADQQTVDRILDKISKSGYDSLTPEEKQILFKASQDH